MPGMTRPARTRPQEDPLLGRPRQAALLTAGVLAVTAVVFALAAGHGTLARIQRLDDAWLRLMISGRAPPLTAIAKVLNVLGLVYVTLPVRILLAGFLALRRRWWHVNLGDDAGSWTMDVRVDEITGVRFEHEPYPFPSLPGRESLTVQFLGPGGGHGALLLRARPV